MASDAIIRLLLETAGFDGKLNKSKQNLKGFGNQASSTGKVFQNLVGTVGKFAGAVGVGMTAVDTFKKAIYSTERTTDKFNSAIYSGSAAIDTFYISLSKCDFSGFLSGLDDVIDKAKEAYAAMDEFGSYMARFNPGKAAMQAQITALQMQARALQAKGDTKGAAEAMAKANSLTGDLALATSNAGAMQTTGGYKSLKLLMSKSGVKDINDKELRFLADPRNWDKVMEMAGRYNDNADKLANLSRWDFTGQRGAIKKDMAADRWGRISSVFQDLRDDTQSKAGMQFNQALNDIYGNDMAAAEIAQLMAKNDRISARVAKGGRTGKTDKVDKPAVQGSIDWYQEQISKLTKELQASADATVRGNVQLLIDEYKTAIQQIENAAEAAAFGVRSQAFKNTDVYKQHSGDTIGNEQVVASTNPYQLFGSPRLSFDPQKEIDKLANGGKTVKESWIGAANAVGSLGSALQGIDDPAAKVAGTIALAIANIAGTFASSLKGTVTPWDWIAGAAAGAATMISTITAIKSATSYAEGGIVGGQNYTDGISARLSSGEMVINEADQKRLYDSIHSGNFGGGGGGSYVRGEDIILGINNTAKRKGWGELTFSKR